MNADQARAEAGRILRADLGELTDSGRRSALPPVWAREWDLSEEDRSALVTHGLPPAQPDGLARVAAAFQDDRQPAVTRGASRYYQLGTVGTARLVAAQGTGVVVAMSKYQDVPPRPNTGAPSATPEVVNSTVALLVDCAWRWHWLVPILAEQETAAGEAEVAALRAAGGARVAEPPDFYAEYQALCGHVLAGFRSADPVIGAGSRFWSETIVTVW